jgi:hypothetical protein
MKIESVITVRKKLESLCPEYLGGYLGHYLAIDLHVQEKAILDDVQYDFHYHWRHANADSENG